MKGKDLKEIVRASGIDIQDIIDSCKIPEGTFFSLYRQINLDKEISPKQLLKLDKSVLKPFISEYLKKQGTDNNSSNIRSTQPFSNVDKQNLTIVPLKAFGGFLMGYRDKVYLDSLQKTSFPWVQGECFAFEVDGFSMMPDYTPQSFVVTTQLEKLEYMQRGKDYVFQTIDGLVLKRFNSIKDNLCNVVSINEESNPVKPIPLKSIKGVFFIEYKINKP